MTEQEKQAALANVQATLFQEVFVPAFVKLSADKGVSIESEEELEQALRIASMVEAQQVKTASAKPQKGAMLKQAADALEGHIYGKQGPTRQSQVSYFAKQAAAIPAVRQAVLAAAQLQQTK